MVGVRLPTASGRDGYSPVGQGGYGRLAEAPRQLPRDLVLVKLRPLLEDEARLKIGHNLKYDLIVLRRAGVDVAPYDDTMLLSYALDAGRNGHGMDELCNLHLKHCPVAFSSEERRLGTECVSTCSLRRSPYHL